MLKPKSSLLILGLVLDLILFSWSAKAMSFQAVLDSGEVMVLTKLKTSEQILLVTSFNENTLSAKALPTDVLKDRKAAFEQILSSDVSIKNLRASLGAESLPTKSYSWTEVRFPYSVDQRTSWAFGMTYLDHQSEAKSSEIVLFQKDIKDPVHMGEKIKWRPHLDYETEIGLLVDLRRPEKLGYFLAVDFSDRGVQAMTYDKNNPGPGFRLAKSFEQGLGLGPLVVFGDANHWQKLGVDLQWNGKRVQTLRAAECAISLSGFLEQVKAAQANEPQSSPRDFDIVLTGTPGGVIFSAPSKWESFKLFLKTFSTEGAKKEWLSRFAFMKPEDRLSFRSSELGYGEIQVMKD